MAIAPMMKAFPLLLLGAHLSLASPLLATRQSTDTTLMGAPIYNSGPYPFVSCNASQGPALASLFPQISDAITNEILPVLVAEGKRDRVNDFVVNTYTTFFSTNPPSDIQAVFERIQARSDTNSNSTVHQPNIICLNEGVDDLAQALAVCSLAAKPTSFTRDPPGSVAGTNTDIYLCPSFWDLPVAYPAGDKTHCPTITNPATHRYDSDEGAVQTQSSTMIHLLAHIYTPNPLSFSQETYPLFGMQSLGHLKQLNNPNNYAYLAALLHGQCPQFSDFPGNTVVAVASDPPANVSTPLVPAVLDDYMYDIGFDAGALQANLTALGY